MSTASLSPKLSRAHEQVEDLLARMRRRLYPETTPVLASYWLKTVYAAGHERGWWREVDGLLTEALRGESLNAESSEALIDIQAWIRKTDFPSGKGATWNGVASDARRPYLDPERLAPYLHRLLNQWLPAEVARRLVSEPENGIPCLAVGSALEGMLVRERLSPETLEMLLQPDLLSPELVYPADAEMLTDVIAALLHRTSAPTMPVVPATLLGIAAAAPLPRDFADTVRREALLQRTDGDEIHVPLAAEQAMEILKGGHPVRIASVIVTMDGRWWEPESLQSGERHAVVYKPRGRLRIDSSADHAKLTVAWPDVPHRWDGSLEFRGPFTLFGREWRPSSLELEGDQAWLHLVFSRMLPCEQVQPAEDAHFRRSHPASIDIAWAALENALTLAVERKNPEPLEQLRRPDFIPLARAIFRLSELVRSGRFGKREAIAMQLRAVRYLQAEVSLTYGRVPWRVLPPQVQAAFLRKQPDAALLELLRETFDGLPDALSDTAVQNHPRHAA